MRMKSKVTARVPMVAAAGVLGALALVACGGDAEPDGKVGGGLDSGAKGGTTGSGAKGSGGTSITIGQGGTSSIGQGGSVSSTGGSSATSGSSGTGGECAKIVSDTSKIDVALLFMVDISGSMTCPVPELAKACTTQPMEHYDVTRWTEMAPALDDFFDSFKATDGFWAGISFFSRHNSCSVADYEKPDAEIAQLPAAATGLKQAVDKQMPAGYTPTVPSLQGALNHATAWATAHTDQNVVVVYATDGYPQGCTGGDNTIDNAAKAAQTAFKGTHQIRTYVLGVGPNLADLNKVAASGGTDQAAFIDTGQDVTAQLKTKFDEIRSAVAVDCKYSVPQPPAGQTFSGNVNVQYASGSQPAVVIPFNDTATCDQGWQYNADKTQILLCGSTCDQIKADPAANIQMFFSCQATVKVSDPR